MTHLGKSETKRFLNSHTKFDCQATVQTPAGLEGLSLQFDSQNKPGWTRNMPSSVFEIFENLPVSRFTIHVAKESHGNVLIILISISKDSIQHDT